MLPCCFKIMTLFKPIEIYERKWLFLRWALVLSYCENPKIFGFIPPELFVYINFSCMRWQRHHDSCKWSKLFEVEKAKEK